MNEERYYYFQQMSLEQKMKLTPNDFTITEFKEILNEMMLNDECKKIGLMHYIECLGYDEIADELQIDRKTVIRRLNKLLLNFRFTCIKLFFKLEA